MPLQNYKYILYQSERVVRSIIERPLPKNREVILLASFPRSGNTWVRFILANMLKHIHGGPEVDFHTLPLYLPDPPYGGEKGRYSPQDFPLFAKTHYPYLPQYKYCKCILIVRKPEEALDSLYRYLEGEHGVAHDSAKNFLQNWRHGTTAWRYFHSSWRPHTSVIVKYEDLKQDPFSTLKEALSVVDVSVPDSALNYGIAMSSRERMIMLRNERGDPYTKRQSFGFVRPLGNQTNVPLSKSDLKIIYKECGDVAKNYGY